MMRVEGFYAMKGALETMCARLADAVSEDTLFDLRMIAHELLTNALSYGGGGATFSFGIEGGEVRITVRGEQDFCPPEKVVRADVTAEHGRGLYLIDALSDRRAYSGEEGVSVYIKIK